MSYSLPRRYWDGRVRQVVSSRAIEAGENRVCVVETLSCGHEKVPELRQGGGGGPVQHRICFSCPTLEEART